MHCRNHALAFGTVCLGLLFLPGGESTAGVDAMQYAWTGAWPANRAPAIAPLQLDGRVIRSRRVPPGFVMISTGGMGVRLLNAPPAWKTSQALPDEV